jgi:long-subunit acyl-CoA synthetase (AMP-forming)
MTSARQVALISNNRIEWAAAFYAANGLGAQLVPMYEAQAEKDWKFIINDSDSKLVLVANERAYEKAEHYIDKVLFSSSCPALPHLASPRLSVSPASSVKSKVSSA